MVEMHIKENEGERKERKRFRSGHAAGNGHHDVSAQGTVMCYDFWRRIIINRVILTQNS
jgi:hypothetical protein